MIASKMSQPVWIDLRSDAPGLGGPFIREFHTPYALFQVPGPTSLARPMVMMAIGGSTKRRSLERIFDISRSNSQERQNVIDRHNTYIGIHVVRSQLRPLIVADCELHLLSRMETILGGPQPGDRTHHRLRGIGPERSPRSIALQFYSQTIAPLAHLICIFEDDFGGTLGTSTFLAKWIYNSVTPLSPKSALPRVLIIRGWDHAKKGIFDEVIASAEFRNELFSQIQVQMRSCGPVQTGSPSLPPNEFNILLENFFSTITVEALPISALSKGPSHASWKSLRKRILHSCEEILQRCEKSSYAFSMLHLQYLLQYSVDHFANNHASAFDVVKATRSRNPISPNLHTHLLAFLQKALERDQIADATSIIASALCLDSFPLEMHCW